MYEIVWKILRLGVIGSIRAFLGAGIYLACLNLVIQWLLSGQRGIIQISVPFGAVIEAMGETALTYAYILDGD
jgi:hypothetical protein